MHQGSQEDWEPELREDRDTGKLILLRVPNTSLSTVGSHKSGSTQEIQSDSFQSWSDEQILVLRLLQKYSEASSGYFHCCPCVYLYLFFPSKSPNSPIYLLVPSANTSGQCKLEAYRVLFVGLFACWFVLNQHFTFERCLMKKIRTFSFSLKIGRSGPNSRIGLSRVVTVPLDRGMHPPVLHSPHHSLSPHSFTIPLGF